MDKKQISKLAEASYVDNRLDNKIVNNIINHLTRAELRVYFKALKSKESKMNVYIDHSFDLSAQNKKLLEDLFPNKQVNFRKDYELLLGIRIIENDMVYNFNMNGVLEQLRVYLDRSL